MQQQDEREAAPIFDSAPKVLKMPAPVVPPPGAIVIGGDYRGLGVVRSLGRHGIPVWVLTDSHRIAAFSRYATRALPWKEAGASEQIGYLLELGARHGLDGWLLFPTGDETAALLAKHHAELLRQYRVTLPPWDVVEWAFDKRLTNRLASSMGVAFPWTAYPKSRAQVESLDCTFPVILKPAIKEGFNLFVHSKAWKVHDRAELLARYDQACTMVEPGIIMIQDWIPGGGETQFSYAALCAAGHPIVSLVARRTRQYPVEFGRSSSYVETIEEPEVEKASQCLLAALSYTGIVEVEFKRDPRDNQFKLLDINPRVWGWHTLSRRFGGDFPYLLYGLMQDEPVPEARIRAGIHWVRGITDISAVLVEILSGHLSPVDYVRSLRGPLESAILARDDPLPALVEVPLLSQMAFKRKAL